MEWTYLDRYTFRVVDQFEEPEFTGLSENIFFEDFPSVNYRKLMSDSEKELDGERRKLLKDRFFLRIGVYRENLLVGWTVGWQDTDHFFYMANSAVLPEHRNAGIYKELLSSVLRITKDAGFPVVHSKHLASNNPVIVPKLKSGFVITGLELLEWVGLLVKMTYFHDPRRRDLYQFRVGNSKPTPELKTLLQL